MHVNKGDGFLKALTIYLLIFRVLSEFQGSDIFYIANFLIIPDFLYMDFLVFGYIYKLFNSSTFPSNGKALGYYCRPQICADKERSNRLDYRRCWVTKVMQSIEKGLILVIILLFWTYPFGRCFPWSYLILSLSKLNRREKSFFCLVRWKESIWMCLGACHSFREAKPCVPPAQIFEQSPKAVA